MGMVVQHNMNAINAYNRLNANVAGLKKASEKLASGYRINRAGDDAAGLAISEKMRSQIRGLNQAVRNSQDGINMIQTFEGAAQETHNILQRMKELASESANGTYDNATDRAAIELEFQQLNDELNQIADTDFNGTIVLNGGEMSDGLRQVDGEFNYANKDASIAEKLAELKAQLQALKDSEPTDIFTDDCYKTLDDHEYQLDAAKQLWDDLGLTDADEYVDITVTAKVADDGTISYEVTSGKTNKGVSLTEDQLKQFVTAAVNDNNGATGAGGFTVTAGGVDVGAIFDASKIKDGDVITIRYTGPGTSPKAPTHVGFANDTLKADGAVDADETHYSIDIGELADADMDDKIKALLDALQGSEWEFDIAVGAKAPATAAKVSVNGTAGAASGVLDLGDGNKIFIEIANNKVTVSTVDGTGAAADKKLFEIDLSKADDAGTGGGKLKFTLNFDSYSAPTSDSVDAETVKTTGVGENADLQKQMKAIQAKIDALEKGTGSTVSDAFDNSTARMTYTDHIILQTGPRTKDAVDFTFNYNQDGSADMGTLKANLNLSARADGLNTENLTLANQKDANYAIDQIDKAINKVSMVRATFGAIQNRLEHKITNLTTTSENLTEAESAIRDTDMAQEMMNYTKFNILQQAAQSMLAQANQQPQSILQLLG